MRCDSVRLEKGMYQEYNRSFSQVLESIDPSDQYIGTPLEGLDAFQRQLKRFDIKVRGTKSDAVEKFFTTSESAVLFPEYVSRSVLHGIEETDVLPMITASTTAVSTAEQANTHVSLKKRGRLLVASYDSVRAQKLDLFSVTLRQIGAHIARSRLEDAVDVLLNGNDGNPANMVSLNGSLLSYDTLLNFWAKFEPYEMNTLLVSNDAALELLKTPEFQNPFTGFDFRYPSSVLAPFGATLIRTGVVPERTVIGLDKRFALEMVCVGGVMVEYDKLINRQFERASITTIGGFSKIYDDASRVLDTSLRERS